MVQESQTTSAVSFIDVEREMLYREPIGAEEILLVGDVAYSLPILYRYHDNGGSMEAVERAVRADLPECRGLLEWSRRDVVSCLNVLRETQKLRELMDSIPRPDTA